MLNFFAFQFKKEYRNLNIFLLTSKGQHRINLGSRIMYKSMMLPEYKIVWENSENGDYFYPENQNYLPYQYTQIEKQ